MSAPSINASFIAQLVRSKDSPRDLLTCFDERQMNAQWLSETNPEKAENHPYSRQILWSDDECEIMVARWTPQTPCLPHNHGGSEGWVFYIEGSFQETPYAWRNGRLESLKTSQHEAGTWAKVSPLDIHSCVSPQGGVSLHVYFPRITAMEVYDPSKARTFTVSDDCGAWLPEDTQLLAEKNWNGL